MNVKNMCLIILTIAAIVAMVLRQQLLTDVIVERFNNGTCGLADLCLLQFPILFWVPAVVWWSIVLMKKFRPIVALTIVFAIFTIVSIATGI